MLALLLVVFIGMIVVGTIIDKHSYSDVGIIMEFIGSGGVVIVIIALFILGVSLSSVHTIPDKVKVLEEQNLKIETQINSIAEDYLAHEGKTYDKLTPDNAEVFAVAYPQLASNETVKKQMDVYVNNNNKITELKLELCNKDVYVWWLYFGGE